MKEELLENPFSEYTTAPEEDNLWKPPEEREPEESSELSSSNDYSEYTSLEDPETRSKLEAKMIQTFLRVMEDPVSASTHRLSAAKEIGELLGKYAKASLAAPIVGDNVQVNMLDDPDKRSALIEGLKAAKTVASGSDSGTRPMEGGKGV